MQTYRNMATAAKASGQITAAFLSTVEIWNPGTLESPSQAEQRFLYVTPEPGTVVFLDRRAAPGAQPDSPAMVIAARRAYALAIGHRTRT